MKTRGRRQKRVPSHRRSMRHHHPDQARTAEPRLVVWPTLLNAAATIVLTTALLAVAYVQYRLERMKAAPQINGNLSSRDMGPKRDPRFHIDGIDRVLLNIDQRGSMVIDVANSQDFYVNILVKGRPGVITYDTCLLRVHNYFHRPNVNGDLEVNGEARSWMFSVESEMNRLTVGLPNDYPPFTIWPGGTAITVIWVDHLGRENARSFEAAFDGPLRPHWPSQRAYELADIEGWYRRGRFAVFKGPDSLRPACQNVFRSLGAVIAPAELGTARPKLLPRIF